MHPVRALCLYEALASLGMGMTAVTASLLQLQVGMSVAEIAFVNVVFWTVIVLAELPTGMLADGRGRIWSVRVGITLFALGCFAYAFVRGVGTALIGEVTLGVGLAFISGAEEAWVTDALKKRGEEHLIGRAFGSQAIAGGAGVLAGGFLGAALGLISLRLGWIGAGGAMLASAAVAWFVMDDAGELDERPGEWEAFRLSWQALRTRPALGWSVAATVVFGLVAAFNHLWQPYFKQEVGQFRLCFIWTVTQSALVLGGTVVRRRGVPEGKGAAGIVLAIALAGIGLAAFGAARGMAGMLSCLFIHEFGRGLFRPIMSVYTQRRIESRFRATFGSLQSLLGKTGLAAALLLVLFLSYGQEVSRELIVFIWSVCGSLLILAGLFLWRLRPRS